LGKKLIKNIVLEIKNAGADACGENGEYHTFVIDGPLFKEKVSFENKGIVIERNYGHLNIV
ncbi:ATP-binding protein, partial [Casaltella massiliensis]|nr:ATP-binding protein [Casaltella massiliensis]